MIEVSNLVKKYGDHTAVDHLSFQIEKGKIYGFLGPNGAGKSTTMNMITGYIASTEGKVMIDGHDILEEPEAAKKCIGYLPEMPPLYFDMTVLEYMKFAADLKKIPRNQKDKQIKEVMDMVKITDMKDRLIKNLSKGYRQRVGLAQAILGYPEVIILDEPTVGLDPKQIIEIRDLIKGLKQKHTVILSSHILSEVRAVCDYVLIISHGKLVASDTPDNLERLAAGSNSLLMKVKGEKDTIRKALETIEGVTGVEMSYDSDEKLWKTKLSIQENVDIRDFRYDGPKPQTSEAAILMLSDTVEAAVRALPDPTQEKISALIRKLVRGKMEDGQLDECTLTFRDIGKICSAFETVLQGVFHERIEYPSVDLSRAQHHGADKTSRKQTVGAKQTEVKP